MTWRVLLRVRAFPPLPLPPCMQESLAAAQTALGLEVSLTGAMGRRTKFQQRSLPQV